MSLLTTTGSKLYIGSARPGWQAGPVEAGAFAADVWTAINNAENLGRVGGEWGTEDMTKTPAGDPGGPVYEARMKVTRKATSMQLILGLNAADAGQGALQAAFDSLHPFAFRIDFADAPALGPAPTPSKRLFIALVTSTDDVLDSANRVVGTACELILQSSVVRIAATTGA